MRKFKLGAEISIPKAGLTIDEINEIQTLTTGSNPAYKSYQRLVDSKPYLAYSKKIKIPDKELSLWREENQELIVPRGLYDHLVSKGFEVEDNTSSKPITSLELKAVLRPYQDDAVLAVTSRNYGVLDAPTGSGKTVMAMGITAELKQKALFVVHTKTLLNQTIKEAELKLGIKPGIIGDGKFEIKDFTVGTIQTLLRRSIDPNEFGLILWDECHHIPATTFFTVTNKFAPRYSYGLSATPKRADGLTWVLDAAIGPTIHQVSKQDLIKNKSIIKPQILTVNTPYKPSREFDPFDISSHLNDITQDTTRNLFIIKYIENVFKQHPNIKPVILTDRIAHVELLAEAFKDKKPIIYHGQLSGSVQKERSEQIKNSDGAFTIATYSSVGEGYDVPLWDTLFLASPFSSPIRLIQVIGRISRPAKDKTTAFVHDFIDIHDSVLYSRYLKREKLYNSL